MTLWVSSISHLLLQNLLANHNICIVTLKNFQKQPELRWVSKIAANMCSRKHVLDNLEML